MAKNELKVVDSFDLQTISGDLAQAVAEEMDGLGSLPFDRVKIPSGGGLAFEVPGEDDENPESATEIVGVILDHHPVNAYWREKFAGGNEQPDCSSFDGKQGVDRETGEIKDCASCPYNQFGSDDKGKACKNVHRVFILRSTSIHFPLDPDDFCAFTVIRTVWVPLSRKAMVQTLIQWSSRQ